MKDIQGRQILHQSIRWNAGVQIWTPKFQIAFAANNLPGFNVLPARFLNAIPECRDIMRGQISESVVLVAIEKSLNHQDRTWRNAGSLGMNANPFLDKSLHQLRDMVPDLSDPELDALCAVVSGAGYLFVHPHPAGVSTDWYFHWIGLAGCGTVPKYTSRIQACLVLLERRKYTSIENVYVSRPFTFDTIRAFFCSDNPCRTITEDFVTDALTRMIERDEDASE